MSREPATLIVLAGGESKRMGFPKHRLTVGGREVLTHLHERLGSLFTETIVVGRDLDGLPQGARAAEDLYSIRSPLVGIHAGLSASRTDLAFVIGCDMPHVEPGLVEYLLGRAGGADVVVPIARGYYEPLCAAYRRSCMRPIEEMIEAGTFKVSALYDLVVARAIDERQVRRRDPVLQSFVNINDPSRGAVARAVDAG